MKHKIALIGFGTVGQGLCEILMSKREAMKKSLGFEWDVVAVSDIQKGAVYAPDGLDVKQLLSLAEAGKSLEGYSGGAEKGWDALRTIRESNATIVCELAYTDIKTAQPATDHCKAAFETGKHILSVMRDINRQSEKTVIIVTHNTAIGEMADKVLRLRSGQVVEMKDNPSPIDPDELRW